MNLICDHVFVFAWFDVHRTLMNTYIIMYDLMKDFPYFAKPLKIGLILVFR